MQKNAKLSDLKIILSNIMFDMGRESDGDVNHVDAIKALKKANEKEIKLLSPALIDIALKRLASEVGRKKSRASRASGGLDLFGAYTGIPDMMSTGKGRGKDFRKATLPEGKAWILTHSGEPAVNPDRNKGVQFMINDLSPYSVTGDETFEELAILKAKALGTLKDEA